MKPCFGYVRVSTLKQGEGVSLEAQKEAIKRFAASNNIEIIRWFEEKVTAAKSGRPEFNAMLKLLRKGRAAGVVMHKIDRSARNFRDWATIGELADAGIDVHFATESLDFRSRGGRLSADIQAVIAADYIRNLREEVRKGINGRLQQGLFPFMAPLGYRNHGGSKPKTPDPVKAPLVRQAFELYASGEYSIRALQAELNQRGLRNRNNRPISKGCLEGILNNPFYAGLIEIRKSGDTFPGSHEPIITMQVFNAVQDIKTGKAAKRVTCHYHTYRGMFRCGGCGRSMIPERQKGYVYYRCHAPSCQPNSIREEVLEKAVADILRSDRLSSRDIDVITRKYYVWLSNDDLAGVRKSLEMRQRTVEVRLERLTDAMIDRLIDEREYSRKRKKLQSEQLVLEQQLEAASSARINPNIVYRALERLKNLAEHYQAGGPDKKRVIAEIATSNRTVWAKKAQLEPSNWFRTGALVPSVLSGGHYRDTSRTDMAQNKGPKSMSQSDAGFAAVIEFAQAPETRRLERIGKSGDQSAASGRSYPDSFGSL